MAIFNRGRRRVNLEETFFCYIYCAKQFFFSVLEGMNMRKFLSALFTEMFDISIFLKLKENPIKDILPISSHLNSNISFSFQWFITHFSPGLLKQLSEDAETVPVMLSTEKGNLFSFMTFCNLLHFSSRPGHSKDSSWREVFPLGDERRRDGYGEARRGNQKLHERCAQSRATHPCQTRHLIRNTRVEWFDFIPLLSFYLHFSFMPLLWHSFTSIKCSIILVLAFKFQNFQVLNLFWPEFAKFTKYGDNWCDC